MPDLSPGDASPDRDEEEECVKNGVSHDQELDYPVEDVVSNS